jgi:EAL domain-containing protein (putative c-di-GMP-specific phosphodiesterase class I)/FixJ family two-component response regulator
MPSRILVVDDEEVNRDICSRRLERSGFEVSCAASGPAAIEAMAAGNFDLVLLDHMMPEMSGVDVVKRLRDPGLDGRPASDIAIIMLTAVTESARIAEALDSGADDYITKPVDYPVALARIRCQLQKRETLCALQRNEEHHALVGRRQRERENELRCALANHEFEVFYQPRIRLNDGAICGFEALVRWRHPLRGLVPPDEFIPVAEASGLILEIGQVVLREACRQTQLWQQQFPRQPRLDIAVNLSACQCAEPGFVARVAQVLRDTSLPPQCLHLELTESLLLDDMDEARKVLVDLKAMGIGLKIDDFGTGYSSLRYLRELPFDTLKIDRSFTMALHLDRPESAEMVKTILTMARNLHLDVIAEGVERAEHVSELRRLGCEFGQGFYFSRPVTADEIGRLLASPAGSPDGASSTAPMADWDDWNHRAHPAEPVA